MILLRLNKWFADQWLSRSLKLARIAAAFCLPFTVGATMPESTQVASKAPSPKIEASYLAENDVAMSKMMIGMAIKPSGDVDRDFADMMSSHHQGAIDMAIAVLRYGNNVRIRRIAQEIVVEQQQEITAMRLAVGESLAPSYSALPRQPITTDSNVNSVKVRK
jgi:uncharacterized protein (DUF305 family)